ncbi:MAG TPA: LysR family transcriptional regulator [Pseudonocardia sp.]|nr:LysR family transcriptional regulator [Pseudonocardia sp.]
MVELRQLEYFVAVAEERHFTRAARRVRVAQSGLSASIRSLEKELGAPLFVRSTRRVDLTDAGHALLAEARHALSTVDAAKEAVAAVQGLLRGTLAIGTLQCLGGLDLIGLLVAFRTAHPGVEVRLRQGGSPELIDRVRAGDLDVAFVSEPPGGTPGIVYRTLLRQPMILACATDHPLAGRDRVALTELAEETFVDFPPGWVTRDLTDRALAGVGVPRRVALEVNEVMTLLDLVGHGMGVALVPQDFVHKPTTARFVPLTEPAPDWCTATAIAADRRPNAAVRALLSHRALVPTPAG